MRLRTLRHAPEVTTMTALKTYLHDIEATLEHVLAEFAQMAA